MMGDSKENFNSEGVYLKDLDVNGMIILKSIIIK